LIGNLPRLVSAPSMSLEGRIVVVTGSGCASESLRAFDEAETPDENIYAAMGREPVLS
jgi:hypothetical protein